MKLEDLKVGDRVTTTEEVFNYPIIRLDAGQTGTVASVSDGKDFVMVKLDRYHEELDEWENELQIWLFDDNPDVPLLKQDTVT